MATIRIQKSKNYTVMSNYHLQDKNLSLKAKGLLSLMLSLPNDWDYTIEGLTKIVREGRDSISSCLHELEQYGYLIRHQIRDEITGRMTKNTEYYIYETPDSNPNWSNPSIDLTPEPKCTVPMSETPITENPISESPDSENPAEINTNRKKDTKKDKTTTPTPAEYESVVVNDSADITKLAQMFPDLSAKDLLSILNTANGDMQKILKAKELLSMQPNAIANVAGWMINAIRKDYSMPVSRSGTRTRFTQIHQRNYDFAEIEKRLFNK